MTSVSSPPYAMTMAAALRAASARCPDKVAIVLGAERRSYAELMRRIDLITNAAIGDRDLKPGRNAAIIARNCIEYLELVCGLPEAGVAVATVSARMTPPEIAAIVDDAQAAVVFTDAANAPSVRMAKFAVPTRIIEIGAEFDAWLASGTENAARPIVTEDDIWTIPYTSGTTGKPKGVLLSHRARLINLLAKAAEYGCFGSDDRFLSITPMNHGPGITFPLNVLMFGGFVEIMDKFDPAAVLGKLKHEGFTGIFTVPTHFHAIFDLPPETLACCRRPPLKAIISNSAPLSQDMKEKIVEYFGDGVLHELFGSTESSNISSIRPADQLRKKNCVGLPFAMTRVKIVNDKGEECAAEEVGEIYTISPYLFSGYWNRPEETAAAFKDGWVSVGDMGKRDSEGYLYVVGRKKEMVISGGVNIYPREIEDLLATHPSVAEIAVIGVPDQKWGERLRAVVALQPGRSLTVEDMGNFCHGRLAAYKIPKDLRIVAALPRNASGKVVKAELRNLETNAAGH